MKQKLWYLVMIAGVIFAILCAGCSSTKASSAGESSSGPSAPAASSGNTGSSAAGAAAAATPATCPTLNGKGTWDGKWDGYLNEHPCSDQRVRFYPATTEIPDPWNNPDGSAGDIHVPVTFTQTGCDVAGSGKTVEEGSANGIKMGCPVTFTGKVDSSGVLTGTWKAYCDFSFQSENAQNGDVTTLTEDAGKFSLWMDPTGNSFVGSFSGNNPGEITRKASSCPTANGNWAGKRG
jgi:hypothetical protein